MMESRETDQGEEELIEVEIKKCCSDCKTTRTPLWRGGPSGPKSLCNACGIRHRKKRHSPAAATGKNDVSKKGKLRNGLKMNLMQPLRGPRRQWGEVERAALLLMALSCGAVFA